MENIENNIKKGGVIILFANLWKNNITVKYLSFPNVFPDINNIL